MSPFDVIVVEFEHEYLVEYEKAWNEWASSKQGAEFMEKWYGLTEMGGTNEIWTLVE